MENKSIRSEGVLLSRFDPDIQYMGKTFLKETRGAERIDLITAEDPLHLFFHEIDHKNLARLSAHIETFLQSTQPQRLVLASGPRPDVLTDEEVKRKVSTAVMHLSRRFPAVAIEGLFVHPQTGRVEQVSSNEK